MDEAHEKGIQRAILISSGFAEAGEEGQHLQKRIAGKTKEYGIRVIGPNALGVYNTDNGVQVRSGCFQLIPSSSIDSWACVKCTLPLLAFGQMK